MRAVPRLRMFLCRFVVVTLSVLCAAGAGVSYGQGAAAPPARTGAVPDVERYFPFRLGDSWTYDWRTQGRKQELRKSVRTRVFDGTEFINAEVAYRLVSDDGSYHLYTVANGTLAIHSSSEEGRLLFYDPPIVLVAPDLKTGERRVVEHADLRRKWTTTLVGFEDVTVPLGTFKQCVKIRLEMESPEYVSDSYHYFAPDVGLVAYRYRLENVASKATEIQIEAELRLARLGGVQVSLMTDLAKLRQGSSTAPPGQDDRAARDQLRRAIDGRYTWDEKFTGFRGDFQYVEDGKSPVDGNFAVDRDLTVSISATNESIRSILRNEISSFVSYRKFNPFDLAYGGTSFRRVSAGTNNTDVQIVAEGDPMGTTYMLRNGEIVSLGRSVGRLRYVAHELQKLKTDDGRTITAEYEVVFLSNEDQTQVSSEHTYDTYAKIGDYWLPTGRKSIRTARGQKTTTIELRLTNLKLQ